LRPGRAWIGRPLCGRTHAVSDFHTLLLGTHTLCFAKTSSAIFLISAAIAVSRGGRRTVSGETMTSACPEGSVIVSPMGPVPVKGLEAPIESYELRGAKPPPLEAPTRPRYVD
jgi:hypothetical protein